MSAGKTNPKISTCVESLKSVWLSHMAAFIIPMKYNEVRSATSPLQAGKWDGLVPCLENVYSYHVTQDPVRPELFTLLDIMQMVSGGYCCTSG